MDTPREAPQLTLFHYDRSTAAQRVRLALDEKEIPWESIIVDTAAATSATCRRTITR
jgi:glutathione S-transferase